MKLKSSTIFFGYLKQLLLMMGLMYAFSNCQVKKSVLHFAGIRFVEASQKSQTQLPVQESCTASLLQKNPISKKSFSSPEIPIFQRIQPFFFQTKGNIVFNKLRIHPAFKFDKRSITYPAIFIVFKNLKIAPTAVS